MKASSVVVLCMLAVPLSVSAADFASLSEARALTDKAMSLFQKEQIAGGYDLLKPYWPLSEVEIDSLANQTSTQWPMVKQRFGASLSTEFIREITVGESLARLVYLHKFQNHALRWVFTFYKPNDRWRINAVSFDDSIDALFALR